MAGTMGTETALAFMTFHLAPIVHEGNFPFGD
jgi:hypothetical protein